MGWQDAPVVGAGAGTKRPAWADAPPVIPEVEVPQNLPLSDMERDQQVSNSRTGLDYAALGGRAVGEGVLNAAATPGDLLVGAYNSLPALIGQPPMQVPRPSEGISMMLDAAGAPNPETPGEKLTSAGVRGAAGAATGVGVGRLLGLGAAPESAAARAGGVLAAQPKTQMVAGATGGASAEEAQQRGASPMGQLAAGLLGGAAPFAATTGGAAATRAAMRGGEAGRQTMVKNIDTFEGAGTFPTVGQATERRVPRAVESILAKAPGAAGPIAAKAAQQQAQVGGRMDKLATGLAPNATAESAGAAVESGITDHFMAGAKADQRKLYTRLDSLIPPASKVRVDNVERALNDLTSTISGAEESSQALINGELLKMKQGLDADLVNSTTRGTTMKTPVRGLPYEAVKGLRTKIGSMLEQSALTSNIPNGALKRVYGAFTQDMKDAAGAVGPEAEQAFKAANSYTEQYHGTLNTLGRVLTKNGGPEDVFKAALKGTVDGASRIRVVMQSLPDAARKEFTAALMRRMGRAAGSQQDETQSVFSMGKFLQNWGNMNPEAKRVIFGVHGQQFRSDMDQIAAVAKNLNEGSKVFANPSGTAAASAGIDVTKASAQVGVVGLTAGLVGSGQLKSAAAVLASVPLAHVAGRYMTSPKFVRWLAQQTKFPAGALPAQINVLAQSKDKELRDIGNELKQSASDPPAQEQSKKQDVPDPKIQPPPAAAVESGIVKVTTSQEANALAPGTLYETPDGQRFTR